MLVMCFTEEHMNGREVRLSYSGEGVALLLISEGVALLLISKNDAGPPRIAELVTIKRGLGGEPRILSLKRPVPLVVLGSSLSLVAPNATV